MAVRSTWNGTLVWWMVVLPVKLYKAAAPEGVVMHQVHRTDGGRVRQVKHCEICGHELQQGDITRGAELAGGETVMLSDEDLASLPLPTLKKIEVLYFCSGAEIDPAALDTSYWVAPDKGGDQAYRLLYRALDRSGKVAVVRLSLRQRESLAIVTPRGGTLALVTLFWPAEVRQPVFVPDAETGPEPVAADEKMAVMLIEAATQAFNADEHHDRYSDAVRMLVDGKTGVTPVPGSGTEAAVGLTEALTASLAEVRAARERKAAPRKVRRPKAVAS